MSDEAILVAVALAIYLADCVVLLERGQALWSRTSLNFGSLHYQARGRVVALLNPLTPFVAVFRTLPLFAGTSGVKADDVKAIDAAAALSPVAFLGLVQLLLVLAALPYCLFQAPGWPFFLALLAAYLNAAALLVLIGWRFRRAHIPARPLAGLGFGWLVCLPLSINAVRKAGLAFDIDSDARRQIEGLPEEKRAQARADLAAQIEEALLELEDGDDRRAALATLQGELKGRHGRL